jgi:hypothetical protein
MLPHEVNQLTIPEYALMVGWIMEEIAERSKSEGVKTDVQRRVEATIEQEEVSQKMEQAIAYTKLDPMEKYRIGILALDRQ